MATRDNYLAHYYEKATIDQLVEEYRLKGYNVTREVRLDKYRVDILAEKDNSLTYIEVEGKKMDGSARKRLSEIENLVNSIPNARFIVVPARYSEEKSIVFNGLDGILYEYMVEEFPDELDELSTHTRIDEVDSVILDSVSIYGQDIVIKCSGQVSVNLQFGSDSEQEGTQPMSMSFPFEFEGTVSWVEDNYRVVEVDVLRIDTGDYYK